MKVAIVGAGYAGLALAFFLSGKGQVTVFENGPGASHASTGLLHPYPGKKVILSERGEEGMKASKELLDAVGGYVYRATGIRRYATSADQKRLLGGDELWMPEGITVFSRPYLTALKIKCGASFEGEVNHLRELEGFDAIVVAAGAGSLSLLDLPLKRTLGQCLVCRWKAPLEFAILAQGHITPTEDPEFCQVGSTYEYTEEPDRNKALALLGQLAKYYPPARDFQIEEIRHGVRVAPKTGYAPIVQKVGAKTWAFTGFGSRGLLYHALFAKELANEILSTR